MDSYLDFLSEDIQNGLLKSFRVGMIRRTLNFKGGVKFEGFVYIIIFSNLLKGGIKE